jgi:colanic acid biosynthesis glycosyl transferase WcaI
MRINIVSINYAPERTGIGVYTTGMAEHFAEAGWSVTVHTGFEYYPAWRKQPEDQGKLFRRQTMAGVSVRRCYLSVPARPTALKRMLHELSFSVSSALSYLFGPSSDVTVIVSPPLLLGPLIAVLGKLKSRHVVLHVQDLQPDAAVELGMLKPGLLTRMLYAVEGLGYRLVDRVSTISEPMRARIVSKGLPADSVFMVRNWANDALVRPQDRLTALRAAWGYGADDIVVLYSGNLGRKQGLDSLLEVAASLREMTQLKFVIVGDGAEKQELVDLATSMGLANVAFQPLQPLERLSELLATADIGVIPQRKGMSDIVMPSKLSNILASGRPVVAAAVETSDIARILVDGKCGLLVAPEDVTAMRQGILDLAQSPELRQKMGEHGRRYVELRLSRSGILDEFAKDLSVRLDPQHTKPG